MALYVYVIIVILCICLGMFISVTAFGTGSKKAKVFKEIYFSVEEDSGTGIVYTKTGDYSVILKLENPVQKNSADIDSYYDFQNIITSLLQSLGEGYAIHKQDVFVRKSYNYRDPDNQGYLAQTFFDYYQGRQYTDCITYITITQNNKKSSLFSYDSRRWKDFVTKTRKIKDQLEDRGISSTFLDKEELNKFVDRFYTQNFADKNFSFSNFKIDDQTIGMGQKKTKIYSLVDVDQIILPSQIKPYTNIEINNTIMPVDLMSIIDNIPGAINVVYNQIIYIPNQKQELNKLAKKKNRHSSLPNPSNLIAVEDIKAVEDKVARDNQQLVYAHFNLVVTVPSSFDIEKCTNHLENAFSRNGISISQKAYNQLELFVGSFPGNCFALNQEYDRFLTLAPAASCLMYKEHYPHTENSPLKVYYTDRQGVPVGIDISGKEGKKYTDNSNFFCLGPSGSGKSFNMNNIVRQMWEQNTDIVMVDTGNSYWGLCEYVGGTYISYTRENPITMNPFKITREELNIEKTNFLKNLIMLIWKGSDGAVTKMEDTLIGNVINEYYETYFEGFQGYTPSQRSAIYQNLLIEEKNNASVLATEEEFAAQINKKIDEMEQKRRRLRVDSLSFNSFYEFSIQRIPNIIAEEKIVGIDLSGYRFQMKMFYKGGIHEDILNKEMDSTLFDETFIVFEIDNIQDDKLLFSIVTLIIMDVFIQKMRIKKNRKLLVIEEAWKAIASPMMAEYIKYLYKTARKFWATVGVVTQELQDIIGNDIVKESIINNSDITILLDQSKFKERFDDIKTILGLTDVECMKIFTINRLDNKEGRAPFKEVFIRRGTTSDVYGDEESRECYMTYTTERQEKEALLLYKNLLGGASCPYKKALATYVRDWNNSGIDVPLAFAQLVMRSNRILNLPPKKKAI